MRGQPSDDAFVDHEEEPKGGPRHPAVPVAGAGAGAAAGAAVGAVAGPLGAVAGAVGGAVVGGAAGGVVAQGTDTPAKPGADGTLPAPGGTASHSDPVAAGKPKGAANRPIDSDGED